MQANTTKGLAAERRAKLAKLRQALSLQDRDITSAPSLTKVDEFQEQYGAADKRNGAINEPGGHNHVDPHKIFYNEGQVNSRNFIERDKNNIDTGSINTEDTDFEDESESLSPVSDGASAGTRPASKSPATDSSGERVNSSTVKVYQNGQYINSMEDLGYQSSISSPNDARYSPGDKNRSGNLLKVERSVDTFSQSLPEAFFKTVKLDLSQSVGIPSEAGKSRVLYDPRIFRKEREKNTIPELDIGDDETEKEYFERMTRMNVGGEDSFVATARTPKFSVSSGQVDIGMNSGKRSSISMKRSSSSIKHPNQELTLGTSGCNMKYPGEPSPGLEYIDLGDPVHSARSNPRSPTLSCRTEFTDPDHKGRSALKNRKKSFAARIKEKIVGKPSIQNNSQNQMRPDMSQNWASHSSPKSGECSECSHRRTTSCYTTLILLAIDIFTICLIVALMKHQNVIGIGEHLPQKVGNVTDLTAEQTVQGKSLSESSPQDTTNTETNLEILLEKLNNLTERVHKLENPPVFACHRTSALWPDSSKRAKVTYDKCSIGTQDMEAREGTFTGREQGLYQFTFSALFVALGGEMVHADLKLERSGEAAIVIGRSTAKLNEKSMVGKARDFFGLDDGKSTDELHTTSSLIVIEHINPGDQVYIEVEVGDNSHLSSDSKKKIHFTGVKISN